VFAKLFETPNGQFLARKTVDHTALFEDEADHIITLTYENSDAGPEETNCDGLVERNLLFPDAGQCDEFFDGIDSGYAYAQCQIVPE
jgi:hypothetical protein